MNQNSIIEIGSKANLVLRFKTEVCLNGKKYAAGEPYLYLKDCNIIIDYSNQDKTGTAAKTLIANSDIKPRTVIVRGVSFSRKLASLLATFAGEQEEYTTTKFETRNPIDGEIFLTETADPEKLFVYNRNYELVKVEYDEDINLVTSDAFDDSQPYFISYPSVKQGTKFELNKPFIPYMSMEIQGVGNVDGSTKNIMIYLDKVSLNSLINFSFIYNDMINVPLEFHIIDDKKNYVVFEE